MSSLWNAFAAIAPAAVGTMAIIVPLMRSSLGEGRRLAKRIRYAIKLRDELPPTGISDLRQVLDRVIEESAEHLSDLEATRVRRSRVIPTTALAIGLLSLGLAAPFAYLAVGYYLSEPEPKPSFIEAGLNTPVFQG